MKDAFLIRDSLPECTAAYVNCCGQQVNAINSFYNVKYNLIIMISLYDSIILHNFLNSQFIFKKESFYLVFYDFCVRIRTGGI